MRCQIHTCSAAGISPVFGAAALQRQLTGSTSTGSTHTQTGPCLSTAKYQPAGQRGSKWEPLEASGGHVSLTCIICLAKILVHLCSCSLLPANSPWCSAPCSSQVPLFSRCIHRQPHKHMNNKPMNRYRDTSFGHLYTHTHTHRLSPMVSWPVPPSLHYPYRFCSRSSIHSSIAPRSVSKCRLSCLHGVIDIHPPPASGRAAPWLSPSIQLAWGEGEYREQGKEPGHSTKSSC